MVNSNTRRKALKTRFKALDAKESRENLLVFSVKHYMVSEDARSGLDTKRTLFCSEVLRKVHIYLV